MTAQVCILLVDCDSDTSVWLQSMLREPTGMAAHDICLVPTVEAALRRLDQKPDCAAVLMDLGRPDAQGLESLNALGNHPLEVPVIVLLEPGNEERGLSAVLAGAQDYLIKGSCDAGMLARALQYAGQRKRIEAAIVERVLRDGLTGLPRRRLLLDRLALAMKRCARDGSSGTLLLIDLDPFKQIGDLPGHAVGDAVLLAVSQRLTALVRDSDTVARLDGRQFVVLLSKESGVMETLAVGEKLLDALRRPLPLHGEDLEISASIGVARFRDATEPAEMLIQRVETAMRATAKENRGRVRRL